MRLIALAIPTSLPITDPVLIVALATLIFLVVPLLFERIRLPGLIGLIVAGALVGPNAAGLLDRDATIVLLGTVGLLYLMFTAGLEIDLHGFQRYRNRSLAFGALSFALPQLLGTGLGLLFGYGWATAILLGSVMASHTLLGYPIASRLGISKNEAVTTAVGGTIITDTAALLVLAVIAASTEGALDAAFWLRLVLSLAVFVAVVMVGLPALGRWFFRNERSGAVAEYVFVLVALFSSAFLAEVAGVEPIIGAFLAGLALNRLIPEHGALMNRIHFFGNAFFIPFFLLSVGMLVDVAVLIENPGAWAVALSMTVGVVFTKWLAARGTGRLFGYSAAEGATIFGLTVPQAAATLAAALIGMQIGLFDDVVLNGVILMILVTCILGPWAVEQYGREVALQEEQKPYEPGAAPQRILIPMANPATAEGLMDLAFLLRDPATEQPLYPLTVVRSRTEASAASVAEAEKMLAHAVIYAAGADVPVSPLTRVDLNFAAGILRAAAETRASTMVIGWDGNRRQGIFGSVLDQLVEQSRQLMIVAKLGHPLATTKRLVLVLPHGARQEPGYAGALQVVKRTAQQLGTGVLALIVREDPGDYEADFSAARPSVPATFERVEGWQALLALLSTRLGPNDVVVVMSARRGTVAWDRHLDSLPAQLARLAPESFLMIYPSELETSAPAVADPAWLPDALAPERVVADLPSGSAAEALHAMLSRTFGVSERERGIVELLLRNEAEYSTVIQPGIVVPHARVAGLDRVLIFLGISREGVDFPGAREPVHMIFLVLSPADAPQAHLEGLAQIARLVSDPMRLRALLESRGVPSLAERLTTQES